MNANEKFKSSVFSTLFSDHDVLRELYSAIKGVDIPPDTPIDINTLSRILANNQVNDLSFTIDNRLVVLIEHQSTINNNMPFRLLLYIAEVYQKIINHKAVLHKKLVKIPPPEFIVLYNGIEAYPDRTELRLSAAFKDVAGLKTREENGTSLELVVQVYNINYGRNRELLEKSKTLNNYSFFIEKIREYNREIPLAESIKYAVKYCKDNNILKQFMDTYGTEVIKMLWEELTIEDEIEVAREEAREEGMEIGLEKGLQQGREQFLKLLDQGLSVEEIKEQLLKF
jgi:predicted transposase/invertase (TIGR01784 family)